MRKKQIIMSRAMMARKIKLERVSKPSHWDKVVSGSGKIAIKINATGNSSQARELLIDMEFFRRLRIIKINKISAAMDISIWMLVMIFS